MYRLDREQFLRKRFVSLWALLGFQAGFINSFGFLACGRFVSHVTGSGTQVGLALGNTNIVLAIEMILTPIFFMLGSFLSGIFTIARIEKNKSPFYFEVTLFIALIWLITLVLALLGAFGPFGEELILLRDLALLYTLSFACGMQNGCFATMTKGQIRTTHLTGITTDIGTDYSRIYFGKLDQKERELVVKINFSRIAVFLAFSMGAVLSVLTTETYHYYSLLIVAGTSVFTAYFIKSESLKIGSFVRQSEALV